MTTAMAVAARVRHRKNSTDLSNAAGPLVPVTRQRCWFGNPAVFPFRGDPWLCDPASQRVCHFGRRCLSGAIL